MDFGGLPLCRRRLDLALDDDAGTGVQVLDDGLVVGQFAGGDDLDVALAGAVVEFEEAEAALGVAAGADPALQRDLAADRLDPARVGDGDLVHCSSSRHYHHKGTKDTKKTKVQFSVFVFFVSFVPLW